MITIAIPIETIDGDPFQWSPEEGSDAIDWFIGIQSERSLVRYASLIHPSEYGGLEVPKQTSFNRSFVSHSLGSFISAIRELVLFATCFQCFYFSLLSLPAIKHAGALDAGIPARAACGVIPAHNVLVKPKRIRLTTDELWALSLLLSGLTDFDGSLLSLSPSAAFPPSEPLRAPPSPFQPLPAPPSPSWHRQDSQTVASWWDEAPTWHSHLRFPGGLLIALIDFGYKKLSDWIYSVLFLLSVSLFFWFFSLFFFCDTHSPAERPNKFS